MKFFGIIFTSKLIYPKRCRLLELSGFEFAHDCSVGHVTSGRFVTAVARVRSHGSDSMWGMQWGRCALRQAFFRVLPFFSIYIIPSLLRIHSVSSGTRTMCLMEPLSQRYNNYNKLCTNLTSVSNAMEIHASLGIINGIINVGSKLLMLCFLPHLWSCGMTFRPAHICPSLAPTQKSAVLNKKNQ
jgi:hypothetical protein